MADPDAGQRSTASKPKPRRRTVASVIGAGLVAVGVVAWERTSGETADEVVARADAERLSVEASFPGGDCEYGGAVGWDSPAPVEDYQGFDRVGDAVEDHSGFEAFGYVRLHFTLPRTAGLTTIDVRDVRLEISDVSDTAPRWHIGPEGCGGGEYSRRYRVHLQDGRAATQMTDGASRVFEPFAVTPGETVFLDYELKVCDAATYEGYFLIEYKPDSSDLQTVRVPEEEDLKMTGLPAEERFMSSEGTIRAVDTEVTDFLPPEAYFSVCGS